MKLSFRPSSPAVELQQPFPAAVPELKSAELAAKYHAARVGGDFYDFLPAGDSKLLFIMLDIAGKRETALHAAAIAQESFRRRGSEIFNRGEIEDSEGVTQLLLEMNRSIIAAAGGVCCAPAFLGCYDETIGVLTYVNAGHTPGVLKDQQGTLLLEANGLPLGLFSHATHDAQFCALGLGAALVLVSKGLVEVKGSGQELGISGVCQILEDNSFSSAAEICNTLHQAVTMHEKKPTFFGPTLNFAGLGSAEPNDMTVVALWRRAERMAVVR